MTTVPALLVGLCAWITAIAVGVAIVPRPPVLEGERWFKTILARLLEASGRLDDRAVAWSPLGRLPEVKVGRPELTALPGAPLPGEVALVEALAARATTTARFDLLVQGGVADLRPDRLDPVHDPARHAGPAAAWASIGDEAAAAAIDARHGARWLVLEVPASGAPKLGAELGEPLDLAVTDPRWGEVVPALVRCVEAGGPVAGLAAVCQRWVDAGWCHALHASLWAAVDEADRRPQVVVAASGTAAPALLRVMAADPLLRDRVLAVVMVGGAVGGRLDARGWWGETACRDWLEANFRHETLDVEAVRAVPWVCLAWLDPQLAVPGLPGLPVEHQRLPRPGFVGTGGFLEPREPEVLRVLDLGVLDPAAAGPEVWGALRRVVGLAATALDAG